MKLKKKENDFIALQRVINVAPVDKNGMPQDVPTFLRS